MTPLDSRGISEGLRGEIDTRIWVSPARVDHAFVRESRQIVVVTVYTGEPKGLPDVVCRWGALYAGAGFGLYFPLPKAGEEVLVFFPSGNPEAGPVAMPRLNNVNVPVAAEFFANPNQVLLKTDARIPVNIQASEINLNQGSKGIARLDDNVAIGTELTIWMTNVEVAIGSLGKTVPKLIGTRIGTISSASTTVKAGG